MVVVLSFEAEKGKMDADDHRTWAGKNHTLLSSIGFHANICCFTLPPINIFLSLILSERARSFNKSYGETGVHQNTKF